MLSEPVHMNELLFKFSSESLILAQNERWRRGLGMQVGRIYLRINEWRKGE